MRAPTRYPPAARVVAVGSAMARLQIRNRHGRWINETLIEDERAYVRDLVRRFEDLAAWARDQALRPFQRQITGIERQLARVEAMHKFLTYEQRHRRKARKQRKGGR